MGRNALVFADTCGFVGLTPGAEAIGGDPAGVDVRRAAMPNQGDGDATLCLNRALHTREDTPAFDDHFALQSSALAEVPVQLTARKTLRRYTSRAGRLVPGKSKERRHMKKTSTKKLSLSRETLAYLEGRNLEQAAAGSGIISSDNKACTYTALGPNTTCWC